MKLACLFGSHWPVAAFSPAREGHQTSVCADCGVTMEKGPGMPWHAVRSLQQKRCDAEEGRAAEPGREALG